MKELFTNKLKQARQSKYWDFVLYFLLIGVLLAIINGLYVFLNLNRWMMPVEVLERLSRLPVAAVVLVFGAFFVDLRYLLFERIFYQYSKRNGVNIFDYQEHFKNLTPWQQVRVHTLKTCFYLFAFLLALMV